MKLSSELHLGYIPVGTLFSIRDYLGVENVGKEVSWKLKTS
jgi:hypothetical protein